MTTTERKESEHSDQCRTTIRRRGTPQAGKMPVLQKYGNTSTYLHCTAQDIMQLRQKLNI